MMNRLVLSLVLLGTSVAAGQYSKPPATPKGSKTSVQKPAITGCPWLTEGTAATALGGDVSATVNMTNALEGECRFSREPGSSDSLEIHVSKAVLPECPAGSMELKGIGNEAARCSPPGSRGRDIEMITSRVRDVNFTVTLAAHREKNAAKSDDPQNDALEQVAEAVAGNLY